MRSIRLFFLIALMAAAVIIGTFIYLRVYTNRINRRLRGELPAGGKAMWSPLRFCITFAAVFALILVILLSIFILAANAAGGNTDNWRCTYDFRTQEEIAGTYLAGYSMEENPGFLRYEAEDENFRYTAFLSTDPFDEMHPGFLVFAEYIGKTELTAYDMQSFCGLFTPSDPQEQGTGSGAGGGTPASVVCFYGSIDLFEGTFSGTYGLFTEEDFRKDRMVNELDYATITARFTINFDAYAEFLSGNTEIDEAMIFSAISE